MITGAVLLDNQDFDPHLTQDCAGAYQFGDRVFGCWLDQGHGKVDLTSAITQSCDVYFIELSIIMTLINKFQPFLLN